MLELRPYQSALIGSLRELVISHNNGDPAAGRKVVIQLPTGGGKTMIAAFLLGQMLQARDTPEWKGFKPRGLMTAHRSEIVEQNMDTMRKVITQFGGSSRDVGAIVPEMHDNPRTRLIAGSVGTLTARLDRWVRNPHTQTPPVTQPLRMVVIDECHHAVAKSWQRTIDNLSKVNQHFGVPPPWVIGLTATPERLDGQGLDTVFSNLIVGPSIFDLIALGALCNYRAWTVPVRLNYEARKNVEFKKNELDSIYQSARRKDIVGDPIAHFKKIAAGRSGISFALNVDHAKAVAAEMCSVGMTAECIHGGLSKDVRRQIVARFRQGVTQVLTNVELFTEGFDTPSVSVVQMLRPTYSLQLYLQMVGRGLRPKPDGSACDIIDHVGNIARHGLPDTERVWTLKGRPNKGSKAPVSVVELSKCRVCGSVVAANTTVCRVCKPPIPTESEIPDVIEADLQPVESTISASFKWDDADESTRRQVAERALERWQASQLNLPYHYG